MTVSSLIDREYFTGDGVNKNFPFKFLFFDDGDIYVYLIDPAGDARLLSQDTEYSVTGVKDPAGGTVVTSTAPTAGYQVLIERIVAETQPTSFRNQGAFLPAIHEYAFDRLTMLIQQALWTGRRSLQLSPNGTVWDFKGLRGVNAGNPILPADVANKRYVDAGDNQVRAEFAAADAAEASARAAADANLQAQLTGNVPLEASAFSEISWHGQVVNNSVVIPDNKNAWSFGPTMALAPGQIVTIGQNSFWTIAESGTFVSATEFGAFRDTTNARLDNVEDNYLPTATFTSFQSTTQDKLNRAQLMPLYGLNACLFGDSITAYGLYLAAMVQQTGLNIIQNSAVAGAPMSTVANQINAVTVTGAQVINIWAGINDYFYSVPLGTIADANSGGANTFYKHCWQVLNNALSFAPLAKVFFISPMKSTYNPGTYTYPAPNTAGVTLDQYRKAMEIMADRMGASFIDMFAKSHLTTYNNSAYTSDSIHPNEVGGAVVGKSLGILLNAG